MPLAAMQCPQCGSPLQGEPGAAVVCDFCGASLRVTRSASGHPLAVLADIEADTDFLAKRAAVEHLQARLPVLRAERERLRQRIDELKAEPVPSFFEQPGWIIPAMGLLLMLCSLVWVANGGSVGSLPADAQCLLLLFCLLTAGLAALLWRWARHTIWPMARLDQERARAARAEQQAHAAQRRARTLAEHGARLASVDGEIRAIEARIPALKEEIDRLSREV